MTERQNYISYLRVFSMICIMLCHITIQSSNGLVNMTSQLFNVGVTIFFIISGYLFGKKNINISYMKWYKRRIMRIVPPYYLFLILLLITHLVLGIHNSFKVWIVQFLFLQGAEIYAAGAEHLWFLTVLMLCYLVTPIIDKIRKKNSKYLSSILLSLSIILTFVVMYLFNEQLGLYMLQINMFIVSYILGAINFKCKTYKGIGLALIMGTSGVVIRIIGRMFFDQTIFYDNILVQLTQFLMGISILMIFQFIFKNKPGKIILMLESISFEVYLVHYFFTSGTLNVMHLTGSFLLNSAIAIILSLMSAYVLHNIVSLINKMTQKKIS